MQDPTLSTQRPAPAVALTRYPAIILAAGLSRRMGQTKALMLTGGKPMICQVVDTCLEAECVSEIFVVSGHQSLLIQEALAGDPVNIVYNPEFETGEMLSSVQAGVRALSAEYDAFYLLPCDQPLLKSSTYAALAEAWEETACVVIPVYRGKRGHPVLISTALIPDILRLHPGDTLKTALVRYRESSTEVAIDDAGVLLDVDTPEDFEQIARANL